MNAILTPSTDQGHDPHSHDHHARMTDSVIVLLTILLICFSLLMIYSTTGVTAQDKLGDTFYYVKRQALAAVIGGAALLICSRIPLSFIRKVAPWLFITSLCLLLLPFLPGISKRAGGATRWINLFGFHFQPGELVKVLFVVFIAGYFSRHETTLRSFADGIFKPFVMVGGIGSLLLLQPDFGSTVVVASVTLAMATAAGVRLRYITYGALVLIISFGLLVVISPYRAGRVTSFIDPWSDSHGRGYQLIQSLIAVGSGQWTGVGIGESQQKLSFLPAAHTDFIFAVISEELGLFGGVLVLSVFAILLWRGLKLAAQVANDTFAFSLSVGLTMLVVVPALLNIGVVIGVLPTKGMVLPLVGYGGSSVIASMIAIGLLLAVKRAAFKELR